MLFKATRLLSDGVSESYLAEIIEAAKKAVAASGESACRFDDDGAPTPSGMYETWPAADGSHQIVSYSV